MVVRLFQLAEVADEGGLVISAALDLRDLETVTLLRCDWHVFLERRVRIDVVSEARQILPLAQHSGSQHAARLQQLLY